MEDELPKNGKEKPFQCDICHRFYATATTLKVHRTLHHTTGKRELCDHCGASFHTRGQLKIHRRVHTGEKPYKCDECGKSFPYRESLITHSTVHTRIKPFLCVVCNASFSCIGNLLKHRRARANKCGLENVPIRHIGPRPNKRSKLLHELSDPVDKIFRCKLCPQEYTTLYLMARHLERLHNVTLDRARDRLQYVKNTTKQEKRYRCKYCDRTYVNATCLKRHILKHEQDGLFLHKCSCCDRYFKTEQETHQHQQDAHRDRLECKICAKTFAKPDQMLRHKRYAHSSDGKDRCKYICAQCGKNFPSRITLSDHERAECGKAPIY
uniref:C2H2-type domain-containing protein n=1 Tax=Anopheles stephensi TaxID=30069 RepID=A0A182Y3B0_ANOST